nr:hypothetical protein [uncultured Draconibacterium sp.]
MNISGFSAQNNMADLRQSADIIDETHDADGIVYFGFCKPGTTGTDSETWTICRMTESDGITKWEWANGSAGFNLVWNDRLDYDYYFQNFRVVING